jgi:hypothetical protein
MPSGVIVTLRERRPAAIVASKLRPEVSAEFTIGNESSAFRSLSPSCSHWAGELQGRTVFRVGSAYA